MLTAAAAAAPVLTTTIPGMAGAQNLNAAMPWGSDDTSVTAFDNFRTLRDTELMPDTEPVKDRLLSRINAVKKFAHIRPLDHKTAHLDI